MNLAQWRHAMEELAMLANEHGPDAIPLPAAMAALKAASRATLYRRLAELRDAGWMAIANEAAATVSLRTPGALAEEDARDIEALRRGYHE